MSPLCRATTCYRGQPRHRTPTSKSLACPSLVEASSSCTRRNRSSWSSIWRAWPGFSVRPLACGLGGGGQVARGRRVRTCSTRASVSGFWYLLMCASSSWMIPPMIHLAQPSRRAGNRREPQYRHACVRQTAEHSHVHARTRATRWAPSSRCTCCLRRTAPSCHPSP